MQLNSKEALENLTYCVNGMERKEKYYKIIKQDLDRLEKLEMAFKIFIEKEVEVNWLMTDSLEMYNAGLDKKYQLTPEEYYLLKEVLGNE